jgi:hypothetical protein
LSVFVAKSRIALAGTQSAVVHCMNEAHAVKPKRTIIKMDNSWGGVYGLAFLGALVYYVQHATTFWEGVVGIFKAIFWPGFLSYRVFENLKM